MLHGHHHHFWSSPLSGAASSSSLARWGVLCHCGGEGGEEGWALEDSKVVASRHIDLYRAGLEARLQRPLGLEYFEDAQRGARRQQVA